MIDPARVAREHYGLDAVATALPGELDLNFRLDAGDERYVLKLHQPREDLALEDAVLEHLRDVPSVPRLVGQSRRENGRVVRLLSWLEGRPWASGGGDFAELGRTVARVDRALRDFAHPQMHRPHRWDIGGPELAHLPHQVIHNDANEHNVLVGPDGSVSLIDFGDVVYTARVCGLAVAGAYAMQGCADPARAVVPLVRGYHEVAPLREDELLVLFGLMRARLERSVEMAAAQHAAAPENDYLLISQRGVPELLARLEGEDADLAHFRFRDACGYEASPKARGIRARLATTTCAPVMDGDWAAAPVLDLGAAMPPVDGLAIGRYDEERAIYTAPEFETPDGRWRTRHMAVDLFAPAGTPVYAPLDGVVEVRENRARRGDYGGLLVLRHGDFWTLHGHLDPSTLASGPVRAGEEIARLGAPEVNGGWEPHLHLQLFTDLVSDLPGRGAERRGRRVAQRLPGPEPDPRTARRDGRAAAAAGHRGAPAGGDEPGALARLPVAAAHRARARRVSVRRFRPRVPRPRQQRRARRALPPAGGRGGRAADGRAQHQHALPARLGDRLRPAARGDLPGPAGRLLLRQLGL